jgi:hypothetical protein
LTEPVRVFGHGAPNRPGDLTTRPPDAGWKTGMGKSALDISPSRTGVKARAVGKGGELSHHFGAKCHSGGAGLGFVNARGRHASEVGTRLPITPGWEYPFTRFYAADGRSEGGGLS